MPDDPISDLGFAIVPGVLDSDDLASLRSLFGAGSCAGRRGLLANPSIAALARSRALLNLVRPHLPADPFAVRALAFEKSAEVNWLVSWHQDLTLAVRDKLDAPGFGPWSVKDGIPHVQPPVEWLEAMISVRLHLDDADESNGALRVIPGSHRLGRLSPDQIQQVRLERSEVLCEARAGDALLMRPLILHASRRSESPRLRRVLHLEYAALSLPAGLQWHESS